MRELSFRVRAPRWSLLFIGLASLCTHAGTPSASELIARFQAETTFWKQPDLADEIAKVATLRDLAPLAPWLAHDDRHVRGNVAYLFARLKDPRGFDTLARLSAPAEPSAQA